MNPDEMYVRERWDDTRLDESSAEPSIFFYTSDAGIEFETWQAARAFTEQREEVIRQVEEEIHMLTHEYKKASVCSVTISGSTTGKAAVWSRILASRQATLSELTRGMTQNISNQKGE